MKEGTATISLERNGIPTAVLDVKEAAAYLAVTSKYIYKLTKAGELPHARIGNSIRFRIRDLDQYLEANTSREYKPRKKAEAKREAKGTSMNLISGGKRP